MDETVGADLQSDLLDTGVPAEQAWFGATTRHPAQRWSRLVRTKRDQGSDPRVATTAQRSERQFVGAGEDIDDEVGAQSGGWVHASGRCE